MTRTLILWRHAKSSWDDPTLADIDRPLSPRGRRAAPQMAGWIAANHAPDCVICSPAQRTRETWACLAARLPGTVTVTFDRRIYEADWPDLLAVVRACDPAARRLLLVGHNPGLEDLTAHLAWPVDGKFATAACAVLGICGPWSGLAPASAELLAFERP